MDQDRRLELQTLLEGLLGSRNVYFQPPANVQMQFPCIVYERDNVRTEFAGNLPYRLKQRYLVKFISRDAESPVLSKIAALPLCLYSRHYTANNLHHDVYNLYF